jgi:hypothetical protein
MDCDRMNPQYRIANEFNCEIYSHKQHQMIWIVIE